VANYVHLQRLTRGLHTFTLFICGRSARFIRWDRSGATVPRSFDYIKEPYILAHFFWRYAYLNHSQRGYDTSVSPASPEDLQQIQHVEKRLRYENPAHREFRIITVSDRDNPEVETRLLYHFLRSTPLAHHSGEPPDRC
jgi:hypothetical protein